MKPNETKFTNGSSAAATNEPYTFDTTIKDRDANNSGVRYPDDNTDMIDHGDEENANRGFVEGTDIYYIKDPITGKIYWDMKSFTSTMKSEDCPDTVNPLLWRMERLNNINGLFQVWPLEANGKIDSNKEGVIYQIRSYDLATMSFIKSDHGWIIIDPLGCVETAEAAIDTFKKVAGDNLNIVAVLITHSHVDHYNGLKSVLIRNGKPSHIENAIQQAAYDATEYEGTIVIAPKGFYDEAISENLYLGNTMSRRAQYMYGTGLEIGPRGTIGSGLGKTVNKGTGVLYQPSFELECGWKSRACLTPEGEVSLTPENDFVLTPKEPWPVGSFLFGPDWFICFCSRSFSGRCPR